MLEQRVSASGNGTGADRRMPPVRGVRLYESVIDALSAYVSAGHLDEARRFPPERELETQLKVSRPVLREAFRVLETHGFVESRQGGGRVLLRPHLPTSAVLRRQTLAASRENLLALWEARELVECRGAELAARNADREDLSAIERPLATISTMSPEAYRQSDHNLEFHLAVARASRNPFFESIVRDLIARFREIGFKHLLDPNRWDELQGDHRPILSAIAARDPSGARTAMAEHFAQLRRALAEGSQS